MKNIYLVANYLQQKDHSGTKYCRSSGHLDLLRLKRKDWSRTVPCPRLDWNRGPRWSLHRCGWCRTSRGRWTALLRSLLRSANPGVEDTCQQQIQVYSIFLYYICINNFPIPEETITSFSPDIEPIETWLGDATVVFVDVTVSGDSGPEEATHCYKILAENAELITTNEHIVSWSSRFVLLSFHQLFLVSEVQVLPPVSPALHLPPSSWQPQLQV